MSVYYVHAPDTGLVKIGFAKLPHARLAKMQVDSPTRLVLLAVEQGSKIAEGGRHQQFASLRHRGEWFRYEGDLVAHIASLEPYVRPSRAAVAGPLGKWLRVNGHTLDSFAVLVGVSHATICRICSGKTMPRRALIIRIVAATDWEVDADALLGIPPKPQCRQARVAS